MRERGLAVEGSDAYCDECHGVTRRALVLSLAMSVAVLTSLASAAGWDAAAASYRSFGADLTASRHSAGAPTSGAVRGILGHSGRFLIDGRGRVVVTHGFNVVAETAPYEPSAAGINDADARFLAAHGFTAVRLGILLAGVEPRPGHFDNRYIRSIKATVDMLGRHGIRSLLDMHQDMYAEHFQGDGLPSWMVLDNGLPAQPGGGFPANYFAMPALERAFDNFWANAIGPGGVGLQVRYAEAWRHVAGIFAGDPAVLGYEIFNEPWPGDGWQGCFPPLGCPGLDASTLRPFFNRVIASIRRVDRRHLVVPEPWLTFDYSAPTALGRTLGTRTAFSFHVYCLASLSAPETPPTRAACNRVEQTTVANALRQAKVSGDALLMTEFGADSQDAAEFHEVIGLADAHNLPWMEWSYCNCGGPTESSAEALVANPKKAPRSRNLNHRALRLLDEPYLQLIAGTPHSSSYDATTRTFTAHYATTRAGGGRFPAGTPTVGYVPPLQYPHGYRVRVTGAHLTSPPGSARLTLVTNPGARHVTVTIRPAPNRRHSRAAHT